MAILLLESLPATRLCTANTAYDRDALRDFVKAHGTEPVIPSNPARKRIRPFYPIAYRGRSIIERASCRLKDRRGSPHDMTSSCSTLQPNATSPLWWHGGSI